LRSVPGRLDRNELAAQPAWHHKLGFTMLGFIFYVSIKDNGDKFTGLQNFGREIF